MEELAQEMDISSKSVVYYHLTQLEKKGCITRSAVNPQQYFIKDEQEKAVAYAQAQGWTFSLDTEHDRIVRPRNYADNFRYSPPRDNATK
jgi:Fe2+ or Zn2+ uptake regulation protein